MGSRTISGSGKGADRYIKETVQSTYPLAVRLKAAILENHAWLPDITIIAYLQLPYTSANTKDGWRMSPSVIAAFLHELGKNWKIEYYVCGPITCGFFLHLLFRGGVHH
jgi:hypothetical protein